MRPFRRSAQCGFALLRPTAATRIHAIVAPMNVVLPTRMTVDEFLAWAVRQEQGQVRAVRWAGRHAAAAELGTCRHCLARRQRAGAALSNDPGVPFYAAPMGMTVRITKKYAFEPDALVAPLPKPERTDLEIPNPVLVVEVLVALDRKARSDREARRLFQGAERRALSSHRSRKVRDRLASARCRRRGRAAGGHARGLADARPARHRAGGRRHLPARMRPAQAAAPTRRISPRHESW